MPRIARTVLLWSVLPLLTMCSAAQTIDEVVPEKAAEAPKGIVYTAMTGVNYADLAWQEVPDLAGAHFAMVAHDPATGIMAAYFKAPAGWSIGRHYHTVGHHELLLEGDFELTMADGTTHTAGPGDYIRGGSNEIHSGKSTGGLVSFVVSDGGFGTVHVDDDDKPVGEALAVTESWGTSGVIKVADRKWGPMAIAPEIQFAPLARNDETGVMAFLVQLPAGYTAKPHFHTAAFHRLNLEGDLAVQVDGSTISGGKNDYTRGVADTVHTSSTQAGVTMFIVTDGPFETKFIEDAEPAAVEEAPQASK